MNEQQTQLGDGILILHLDGAFLVFDITTAQNFPMIELEDVADCVQVFNSTGEYVGDLTLFQWSNIPQSTIDQLENESDEEINEFLELCMKQCKQSIMSEAI